MVFGGFDARSIRGGKSGALPRIRVESRLFASKALSCVATASVVNSSVPPKLNLLSMVERRKLCSYGFCKPQNLFPNIICMKRFSLTPATQIGV